MNDDDFIILVSRGSRHCWVSTCTVWPSHSKWLSRYSNESATNFVLSMTISLWKLFRWFRRLQLWATGDWQLHHDNMPSHASHLMQSFLMKHPITQVSQPSYSPDLAPWNFWLFPKLKSPLKGKRFQTIDEIQENRMGQLMAIRRTVWSPKVTTLKGLEVSSPKVPYHWNPFIYHSWNDKITRVENRSVVPMGWGCGGSGMVTIKWQQEGLCGDGNVLFLDCITVNILLWHSAVVFQGVSIKKNWKRVCGISLYYFLKLDMHLQLS